MEPFAAASLDPFASQQNAQAGKDPFALSKQPNTNAVTQGMSNLDPFNTENNPPAPQPSLDPFAPPQIAATHPTAAPPAATSSGPAPHCESRNHVRSIRPADPAAAGCSQP